MAACCDAAGGVLNCLQGPDGRRAGVDGPYRCSVADARVDDGFVGCNNCLLLLSPVRAGESLEDGETLLAFVRNGFCVFVETKQRVEGNSQDCREFFQRERSAV